MLSSIDDDQPALEPLSIYSLMSSSTVLYFYRVYMQLVISLGLRLCWIVYSRFAGDMNEIQPQDH